MRERHGVSRGERGEIARRDAIINYEVSKASGILRSRRTIAASFAWTLLAMPLFHKIKTYFSCAFDAAKVLTERE